MPIAHYVDYTPVYRTRERAEEVLETLHCEGDGMPGMRVEPRPYRKEGKQRTGYIVTYPVYAWPE